MRLRNVLVMLGACAALTVTSGTPAQASGTIGACYPWLKSAATGQGGGWCNGTGPDWTYRGFVNCSNGRTYTGIQRWAGDRRGSTATCASGARATTGGLRIYYKNNLQYSDYGWD